METGPLRKELKFLEVKGGSSPNRTDAFVKKRQRCERWIALVLYPPGGKTAPARGAQAEVFEPSHQTPNQPAP